MVNYIKRNAKIMLWKLVNTINSKWKDISIVAKLEEYKKKGLSIGDESYVAYSAHIVKPAKVILGKEVHVNEGVYIVGPVVGGDRVTFSYDSIILGVGYDTCLLRKDERKHADNPTYIGDSTWICGGR